jgi:hypothetical protein
VYANKENAAGGVSICRNKSRLNEPSKIPVPRL